MITSTLDLPFFIRWLKQYPSIIKCRSCEDFIVKAIRPEERPYDTIYLQCKCGAIPQFELMKLDISSYSNNDIRMFLMESITEKVKYWNDLAPSYMSATFFNNVCW